jgi:hypothetical protein
MCKSTILEGNKKWILENILFFLGVLVFPHPQPLSKGEGCQSARVLWKLN